MNATLTARETPTQPARARAASPATRPAWRLPLAGIASAALVYRLLPPWGAMCLWAMVLFYAFKWITYRSLPREATKSVRRTLGYFLAWPGLDAATFFSDRKPHARPRLAEWLRAGATMSAGIALIAAAAFATTPERLERLGPLAVGWLGMIGIVTALHFGSFRLAALAWQAARVAAEPIMDRPLAAGTLAEFWDRRWNKAFRVLAHRLVFDPLVRRIGAKPALVAGFAFSGLVHDTVISLPARAGYGMPTLYFLLQAGAILFARSALGMRLGLSHGLRSRTFALVLLVGPLGLLFHAPFVRTVVVPLLKEITRVF